MEKVDSTFDFWLMKPSELGKECSSIAQAVNSTIDPKLRAEAGQLAAEWREAIAMPTGIAFDESRRAALIAALRRRTIEILIRVWRNGEGVPEI
jgi:hypothetical protein